MRIVSARAFRIACALDLALYLIIYLLQPLDNALLEQFKYQPTSPVNYDMPFPLPLLQWVDAWVNAALVVAGLLGSIWFKSWARKALAGSLALTFVSAVIHGVYIAGPIKAIPSFCFSALFVWLLTLTYWSPISERFGPK